MSFPECHIIRIIQNVDISDWLFSLNDLHLVSSMSFQGLVAHFFLIPEQHSSSRWTIVYPFTYRRTSWLLPRFGIFEQRCYNHPCAGFYVDRHFPHLWVNTKECDFRIMSKGNASFCKKPPHHLPRCCTILLPASGAFLGHNLLKLFTLRLSWWLLPLMLQPVWQEFKSIWTLWPCASRNQGSGAAGDAGTSFRT